jgi:hypothetical protein
VHGIYGKNLKDCFSVAGLEKEVKKAPQFVVLFVKRKILIRYNW